MNLDLPCVEHISLGCKYFKIFLRSWINHPFKTKALQDFVCIDLHLFLLKFTCLSLWTDEGTRNSKISSTSIFTWPCQNSLGEESLFFICWISISKVHNHNMILQSESKINFKKILEPLIYLIIITQTLSLELSNHNYIVFY